MKKTATTGASSTSPWALVLAGGFGRRLEPVTRALYGRPVPKQFCRMGRDRTLLQDTVRRLHPPVARPKIVVVADASTEHLARRQVGDRGVTVIGQPADRGTGPGVLLPMMHILRRDPEAIVVVSPSDHAVGDVDGFRRGIREAVRSVERASNRIVLFGVEADGPRTDYGWIVPGERLASGSAPALRRVIRFTEKPPLGQARELHEIGALWNTFVMVGKGRTFLELYRRRLPALARFFETYAGLDASRRERWLVANYGRLEPANFSEEILSRALNLVVYTWPVSLNWTDLGTPDRLFAWLDGQGRLGPLAERLRRRGATELIRHYVDPVPAAAV